MANTFAPSGFQAVRRIDGASWSDNITERKIAAANTHAFFKGDVVVVLSTGYIDRLANAAAQAQTFSAIGIFLGCEFLATSQGSPWSNTYPGAAQTQDTKCFICQDPNVVFRVQVGTGAAPGTAGGPVTIADLNATIPYTNGTGNTANGLSGGYIDYANLAQTATLPFMIVGLVQDPPGVNGTDIASAGNIVEVRLNQTIYQVGQSGV